MIQRVQSIYLLLVTVLLSFLLIRPYAELTLSDGQHLTFRTHAIKIDAGKEITAIYKYTIPVMALVLITALLSLGNILLFNRRIIQLRICMINTVLLIAMLIIMFVYYSSAKGSLETTHHVFRIPAIFPILSIVFNLMAHRYINRDELLVNSYKRIR